MPAAARSVSAPARTGAGSASPEYGRWARGWRKPGTVYGGPGGGAGNTALSVPDHALENSGSLTGQILSHGRVDEPTPKSRTAKVVVVLLIGLAILVAVGLLVAIGARDVFASLFDGLLES